MITSPFLTQIDPRRAVKGSRDPLGQQPIWTWFGRKIIGNLTTVSTSVPDFTIALLGFHFIELAVEMSYTGSELDLFLRWEQLAGYARVHVNGEQGFRGTERVHRTLEDGDKVTLSAERAHQILGSQKIYGIWGLYTVPARGSGLLVSDPLRLSPAARDHATQVWAPVFDKAALKAGRSIVELLMKPRVTLECEGRHKQLLATVASLIRTRPRPADREFYGTYLVNGGPQDSTQGLQPQLAEILRRRRLDPDTPLSPTVVAALAKDARTQHGKGSELAGHLQRILAVEPLLALTSRLFGWLLAQDGQEATTLARDLRRHWGAGVTHLDLPAIAELEADLAAASTTGERDSAVRWVRLAEELAVGHYGEVIRLLLEQNRYIQSVRNSSSPWAEVDGTGKLRVRFRDERSRLPERDELRELWRYTYFIDSLRIVVRSIGNDES